MLDEVFLLLLLVDLWLLEILGKLLEDYTVGQSLFNYLERIMGSTSCN